MNWKKIIVLTSMTIFTYNFAPNKVSVEPPKKKARITNVLFDLFRFRRSSPSTTTTTTQQEEALINKDKTSLEYFITRASRISSVRQDATTEELTKLLSEICEHKSCRQIFSQFQAPVCSEASISKGNYFAFLSSLSSQRGFRLYSQLNAAFIICKALNMNKHLDILSQFFRTDATGGRTINVEQARMQRSNSEACALNAFKDALLLINEENIESNIMRCYDAVKSISELAKKLYALLTKPLDSESFVANHILKFNVNHANVLEATTDLIAICCYVEKTLLNINTSPWDEYFLSDTTINVNKVLENLDKIPTEAEKLINRLEQRTN